MDIWKKSATFSSDALKPCYARLSGEMPETDHKATRSHAHRQFLSLARLCLYKTATAFSVWSVPFEIFCSPLHSPGRGLWEGLVLLARQKSSPASVTQGDLIAESHLRKDALARTRKAGIVDGSRIIRQDCPSLLTYKLERGQTRQQAKANTCRIPESYNAQCMCNGDFERDAETLLSSSPSLPNSRIVATLAAARCAPATFACSAYVSQHRYVCIMAACNACGVPQTSWDTVTQWTR